MTKPTWNHGYFTHDVYTAGFFREMAPNWLDFAALMQGAAPPRQGEGEAFRYLDLGCGMGFAIALLAALYPEGRFVGVDFHPHHIANGRGLVRRLGLTNLQLLEADLLDLQRDPVQRQALLGAEPFHYVVSHGVATWVVEPVQQALLAVASASLGPAGLFYCSYNTYPGWLSRSALQQLITLQRRRSDPSDPQAPISWAMHTLRALLGDPAAANTPFGRSFPGLAGMLDQHERCAAHKLTPLTTATLTELFPGLLPVEPLTQPRPSRRQPRQFKNQEGGIRIVARSWPGSPTGHLSARPIHHRAPGQRGCRLRMPHISQRRQGDRRSRQCFVDWRTAAIAQSPKSMKAGWIPSIRPSPWARRCNSGIHHC